jgi:superfamily I DNA and/or RNA helicase
VRTYFRCRVTIVVGLPSTGKSTLIDVILALEGAFHNKCTYVRSTGAPFARSGGGPHGLVVDNASQSMEANAAYLILRAHSMGQLRRVLLIGDHRQHPPALLAERNPCSASGLVSLIERQIRAGTSYIQLQTQYI